MEENKKADKTSGNKESNAPHIEPINISELIKIEKSNSRKNMGNRDSLLVSYLNIIHNSITVHLGKNQRKCLNSLLRSTIISVIHRSKNIVYVQEMLLKLNLVYAIKEKLLLDILQL